MANDLEQTRTPLEFNLVINRGLTVRSEGELWRFAQWALKSKMAPKSYTEPEQVIGAIMAGIEVGLSPLQSLRGIAVIGNAPCIWGDCRKGLILASGQLTEYDEFFEGEESGKDEDLVACCTMGRGPLRLTKRFSWGDAKRAGLLGKDTYRNYLKDMLMNRARWRAQSALFADCLGGMAPAELPEYHKETLPVENEAEPGEEPPKVNKMAALVAKTTPKPAEPAQEAAVRPVVVSEPTEPDEPPFDPDPPLDAPYTAPEGREPGSDDDRGEEPEPFFEECAPATDEQKAQIEALKKEKKVAPRQFANLMVDAGSEDAQVATLTTEQADAVIVALGKLKL
jgi:hypothetical protein